MKKKTKATGEVIATRKIAMEDTIAQEDILDIILIEEIIAIKQLNLMFLKKFNFVIVY